MRRRSEADFTEFAAAALRRLRRTAYLMCGDWHRAEDAAQDALVRVYRAWDRLDHHAGLNTYAHRAVVSVVLDQAKRPWRREFLDDEVPDQPLPDPARTVDDRLLVIEALARLAPRQRACVVLRHYADLSIEETAQVLGIGTGAVKSQTSRGLAALREQLHRPGTGTAAPADHKKEVLL
ncbi:RNA polymerase, sigma-24 subunit, ECF subfamily [Kribbella flavida DSM 17836]|uniref:RNA polymerase, sigma-24 subunit, ECF subfamily n=1 Tax=Kribbella flavida (strain DSM 17836 / JCM 10339 / NBRC 14399) TaxID=479435 RepID=D2Q4K6_KRIFD|nr:SigE family RNA polymerase sigma factor [Kribbella flavida]ADB32320.1 RNA polymerase, sigma-24 subunit, ECF subfamily [Kribbella flavida DSM 17836]